VRRMRHQKIVLCDEKTPAAAYTAGASMGMNHAHA
jgi:hypothetical protein